jgi:2-polyprenyl-3-methyl-5-hydroxy-6-metoxy-1,4-benzoquinol methylase
MLELPRDGDHIATEAQPTCPGCAGAGQIKYANLTDRVFGTPGSWSMKECSDAACGMLWLDPRPTARDVAKAYRNYFTHGLPGRQTLSQRMLRTVEREHAAARYGFANRWPWPGRYLATGLAALVPGHRAHLDLCARYLKAATLGAGRLLDVGCGDGLGLSLLGALGWKVSGVEVDARAVRVAQGRGLDVRGGTLSEAGFAEETFDAVTSSHVIEHVHDCRAFLGESRRVLKTGGTLVAVTPNVHAASHARHGRHWLPLDPPRHLLLFTRESLGELARSVGLRDVRVTTTARAVALTHIASTRLRRDGVYEWGRFPGLALWLAAQLRQICAPLAMQLCAREGEELVLMATK